MDFARIKEFFRRAHNVDSVLLASWDASSNPDANFYYYSGVTVDRATFIAQRDAPPVLIVNQMNAELAEERFDGEVIVFKRGEYFKVLRSQLDGCKKLAVAKSSITATLFEKVRKIMRDRIVDATEVFYIQRAVKSEKEIDRIKRAAGIAHRAFKDLYVRPGKTELELQRELCARIYERGGEPSFKPIVAFGSNSRFPHAESRNRRLRRGEIVLIDWGARWNGYCSDHTRCIFMGDAPKEQVDAYEKLQSIFVEIIRFIKPGVEAKGISREYIRLLNDAGLPAPPHGLGHGIGLEVHEYPSFAENTEDVITKHCAIAIEPAAYFKDFGVRFEDVVVVGQQRATLI